MKTETNELLAQNKPETGTTTCPYEAFFVEYPQYTKPDITYEAVCGDYTICDKCENYGRYL